MNTIDNLVFNLTITYYLKAISVLKGYVVLASSFRGNKCALCLVLRAGCRNLFDRLEMAYHIKDSDDLAAKLKDAGDHLVVIDFFAKWCGPCKMMSPRIEEMVNEYPDVVFLKVDVDECEQIATEYDISSMPTFVFVKNSVTVDSFSGANCDKLRQTVLKYK